MTPSLTSRPEPCLSGRCWSPISCADWGYCRQRNMALKGAPSAEQQREWRELAAVRSTPDHKER